MSSYVVLARKWRPQRFDDLTGQEHVARTLCNSIEQNRVPHAMLFTGARGVGKTTTARLLAMSLNCADGPTTAPCGKCDSCVQIQKSQSVDVLEIDGASNRGINEIRELREGVRYAPSRDRYKVYIIDEVHMLTTEAFNALLKTLEEPPAHVVFMFATTEAQKIPVTILSRCQRFDFRRIPHNEIVNRLRHIADAEGLEIDAEVLGIVARQAAGGMRDALSLLDQVIAFSGTTIRLEDAESILGAAERRRLFELSGALVARDVEAALRVVDAVDAFGVDITHFSTELVAHLRDLSIVAVAQDPTGLVMLTDGELADARAQVENTDVGTLHRMFEIMVDAGENIARSNHPKLLFEMVLVRLTAIEPAHSLIAIAKRLEALANGSKLPPPTGGSDPGNELGAGSDSGPEAGPRASSSKSARTFAIEGSAAAPSPPSETLASAHSSEDHAPDPTQDAKSGATALNETLEASPTLEASTALEAGPTLEAEKKTETDPVLPEPSSPRVRELSLSGSLDSVTSKEPEPAIDETSITAPGPQEASPSETPPDAASPEPALGNALAEMESLVQAAVPAPSGEPLSSEAWKKTVGALRKEQPHAGELIATAYAVPTEDGVMLGLDPALVERVDTSVLGRLNALCSELGGGSHNFSVTTLDSLEGSPSNGYSVVEDERAAIAARQAAAEVYVREHSATSLLMERFPGSKLHKVQIPTAIQEAL